MNRPIPARLLALLCLLAISVVTSYASDSGIVDFEQLPEGSLAGRSGWAKAFNQFPIVTSGRGGESGKVLTNPSKGDAGASKILESGNPFSKEQTHAAFEVDMQFCGPTNGFSRSLAGLGLPNGPRIFSVGLFRAGQKRDFYFSVYKNDREIVKTAPIPKAVDEGDWLRLSVEFDFTANEGNGTATLLFRNLSKDETFAQRTGLDLINLSLAEMGSIVADPANWQSLVVRLNNSDGTEATSIALRRIRLGAVAPQ